MSQPRPRGRARSEPATLRRVGDDSLLAEEVEGIRHGRFRVTWQVYAAEWNTWTAYRAWQSRRIEAAWQRDEVGLQVSRGVDEDETWTVCFVSLTQTNNSSGTRRPIQRVLVTHW